MSMMEEIIIENDGNESGSRDANKEEVTKNDDSNGSVSSNVVNSSTSNATCSTSNVNKPLNDEEYLKVYKEETLNNLRDGILKTYQPPLEHLKKQLEELTMKQNILVEQLHNENLNLVQKQNSDDLQELFKKVHMYRNKLVNMKTDMRNLHDKSQKLVKRAVKLQQLKEKDDLTKQEQREKEVKLIGNK